MVALVQRQHVQRHVRQICTRVLRAQQLLHEAVRLFRQRLVQLVGGFVLGVAVRAPVVQLHHVQHFRHRGHYGIHAVMRLALRLLRRLLMHLALLPP